METRWYDITDIQIKDDEGIIVFSGPKFQRCFYHECGKLVTYGYLEEHQSCFCGGRKFRVPSVLTEVERQDLLSGAYPLTELEVLYIGNDDV